MIIIMIVARLIWILSAEFWTSKAPRLASLDVSLVITSRIKMITVVENLSKTPAELDVVAMDCGGCLLHVFRLAHLGQSNMTTKTEEIWRRRGTSTLSKAQTRLTAVGRVVPSKHFAFAKSTPCLWIVFIVINIMMISWVVPRKSYNFN